MVVVVVVKNVLSLLLSYFFVIAVMILKQKLQEGKLASEVLLMFRGHQY